MLCGCGEAGGKVGVGAGLNRFVEGAREDFVQGDGAGAGGLCLWRSGGGGGRARVGGRRHWVLGLGLLYHRSAGPGAEIHRGALAHGWL